MNISFVNFIQQKSSLQLKETIDLVLSNPSFEEFRVQFTTMVNFQILSEKQYSCFCSSKGIIFNYVFLFFKVTGFMQRRQVIN